MMTFKEFKQTDFFYPAEDYGEDTIVLVQMPDIIRYKTAQEYYGVSKSTIERIAKDAGATCKVGGAVWIDREIVEDFIKAHNIRTGIRRR